MDKAGFNRGRRKRYQHGCCKDGYRLGSLIFGNLRSNETAID